MIFTALDPVCNMKVKKKSTAGSMIYDGKTYYFCSPNCHTSFKKAPKKYLGGWDAKKIQQNRNKKKKKKGGGGCCG